MKRLTRYVVLSLFVFFSQSLYASVIFEREPGYAYMGADNPPGYSDDNMGSDGYVPQRRVVHHHYYYRTTIHHSYHPTPSLPATIAGKGERVIVVDPKVHVWGAYSADGKLLRSGLATAGSSWCEDLGRPCRTSSGVFRISSLGSENCRSKKFPIGEGGAPMPYCMYFNGGQGIHGSHELAYANISHGCVRVSVSDARWLRFNFSHINTKVIIKPY